MDPSRVNSSFVHSAFALSRVATAQGRAGGWWDALRQWRQPRLRAAVADEVARPQLAPNLRHLAPVAVLWALIAALIAASLLVAQQRRLAQEHGQLLIARADRALERIDDDLVSLAAYRDGDGEGCSLELTLALARRSLDAELVRRYLLQQGARTCGPLGEQAAPAVAATEPGFNLVTGTTIAPRLFAMRALDTSSPTWAEIDLGSLRQQLQIDLPQSVLRHAQLRHLHSGAALLALDDHAQPFPSQSLVAVVQDSARYPIQVKVSVDPGALKDALALKAGAAALATLALLGAAASVAWRLTVRRARLRERISLALRKRQFEPFVQPVVELGTGRCLGGEILMRWNHPQRGWIGPAEFIDEAERTGLIVGMTQLVMERAAARLAPLARLAPELQFAFNITPMDLRQPGFAGRLAATFQAESLPPEQVMLELTERDLVDPQAAQALMALRGGGWRIAMDDFGTGQSSLSLLERLQVDRIKIDRSFVQTIDTSTRSRPVLDAIIGLAHGLGVPLVAEGVETEAQREYLAARGVSHAQGYLWAKPMALADFERWLAERDERLVPAIGPAEGVPGLGAATEALWVAIRAPGALEVRDRSWHARSWPRCFVGREAVDWIARHQGVSRAEAVRLGRRLAAFGLIRHVADEHDFRDADLFYRLVDPSGETGCAMAPLPESLVAALRAGDGLALGDHRRGVALHRRCARGRDIVAWMAARYAADRSTALQWGSALMRQGRLRHVYDDRPFSADAALFRPA